MNRLIIFALTTLICFGCSKEVNLVNPDVKLFVKQLKNGTYNNREMGENGEELWLQMPKFTSDHIRSLLDFANDTSSIADFPTNPISSRTPFPQGRDHFILGECLLWTIEGIRNGYGFGSLDPYLIDTAKPLPERYNGLSGAEILSVWNLYSDWWRTYEDSEWQDQNPLENSTFRWF
jgi:hypothetical protein